MKTIKIYEEFNSLNEGKASGKADFDLFMNFFLMSKAQFKENYKKELEKKDDAVFNETLELAGKCKHEADLDINDFPQGKKVGALSSKAKYPHLYMFLYNETFIVFVSSEIGDLDKKFNKNSFLS